MNSCQQVTYFEGKAFFVLRLEGALRFEHAPCIDTVLESYKDLSGKCDMIFDLTKVKMMDSTVLGTLARFIIEKLSHEKYHEKSPVIVCADKDVQMMLNKIGLKTFFRAVKSDQRIPTAKEQYHQVIQRPSNKSLLEEYVLNAHQALSDLNQNNPDYKTVIRTFNDK
jgi:anti-anti-sigma factor